MIEETLSYLKMHSADVLIAFFIAFIGFFVAYFVKKIMYNAIKKHAHDKTAKLFITNFVYLFILSIIAIMVLNKLGVPTTSLIAVLGASSLAIALALKDSLSNVASGIILIFEKPFKIGDEIEVASVTGTVVEISLYSTTLKTADNKFIFIPNAKVVSDKIVNFTTKPVRRLLLDFYVDYPSNLEQIELAVLEVVAGDKRALLTPKASFVVSKIDSIGVLINVFVWVGAKNYTPLKADLLKNILNVLIKKNVKMSSISVNSGS